MRVGPTVAVDAARAEPAAAAERPVPAAAPRRRIHLVLGALVALPILVAVVRLRDPRWFPTLDLAMTELRVRDVGSGNPPLIGLPGRIGTLTEQGSHPGPMSFWVLWPLYRLFGGSAWALQVSTAALQAAAVVTAVWLGFRRGGTAVALGVAAVTAVLVDAYGPRVLTEPWNPYLPVLWWLVLLLAVWSVVDGDVRLLPLAAVAGALCMQTHSPYLGLVVGLGAFAALAAARADRRWLLVGAAVTVVLWLPPLVEELRGGGGNLSRLWDHFGSPPEAAIGLRRGAELLLLHLDPVALLFRRTAGGMVVDPAVAPHGSLVPGTVLLVAWAASVVLAVRRRVRPLLALDVVLAAALVLGLLSLSRIFGDVFAYLALWGWGLGALVLLATVWGIGLPPKPVLAGVVAAAAVAALWPDPTPSDARLSATVGRLLPATEAALSEDATYLLTWTDTLAIGSQGFALLNELDRDGFDVRVPRSYLVPATGHRVVDEDDADALVHLATGPAIEVARAEPSARELAFADPRTPAERAEFDALRLEVIDAIREAGHADFTWVVDENLFAASIDPRVPEAARAEVRRMLALGLPAAVFLAPPDARIAP